MEHPLQIVFYHAISGARFTKIVDGFAAMIRTTDSLGANPYFCDIEVRVM